MGNAIKDWPKLASQCYEFTAPGGYCEFLDLDLAWTSPDGSLTDDMASLKFNKVFLKTCDKMGIDPCPGPKLERCLKTAGYQNVVTEKFVIPVGTWPKDKQLKAVGAWNYLQINEGLEGFVMALFTRQLGYTQKECEVICAKVRSEMRNQKMHAYMNAYVVPFLFPFHTLSFSSLPTPLTHYLPLKETSYILISGLAVTSHTARNHRRRSPTPKARPPRLHNPPPPQKLPRMSPPRRVYPRTRLRRQ